MTRTDVQDQLSDLRSAVHDVGDRAVDVVARTLYTAEHDDELIY